ncbi:MAG: aspartate kinase [Bacteroidetes bacterium]|nr:MAG: aspartate kinase [Bacteroidota bacterium]
MNSIGKITEELINKSPFLREAMTDDLINISALARKLKPEIEASMGKEVKEGAIVMAIKRMTPGLYHRLNIKITNVMGDLGDFLVRSNLSDFTFENTDSLKSKQAELVHEINKEGDSFFTICKGVTETTFIVSSNHDETIKRTFKNERLKSHSSDLASVTVKLPTVNTEIYGIYYYILKHLAWEGINIVELVSTSNEFTVVVKQEDVDKAFKILMQLKRGL